MKLTAHSARRLAGAVGLACALATIPVAALASTHSSATAAGSVRPCVKANTRVWMGQPGDGTAGTTYYQIEFSDIGSTACSLYGYPGISMLNARGWQVGHAATHSGTRRLVVLRPGGTAHVVLAVGDAGNYCSNPVTTTMLRVFPPGQRHPQVLEFPSQACRGISIMGVDAVHPRAGVPFYSRY